MIIDTLKPITPAFLKRHGFALVVPGHEEDFENFPSFFDVPYDEKNDLCYLEKKLDRKQFCIVLTPSEYDDTHEKFYSFEIYIQDDIGCGFVNIPNQFCEMTEYHFKLLYEAIRREKL